MTKHDIYNDTYKHMQVNKYKIMIIDMWEKLRIMTLCIIMRVIATKKVSKALLKSFKMCLLESGVIQVCF